MKFVKSLIALLIFCNAGYGQDKALTLDERGKLIFYEVVGNVDSPIDSLFRRAEAFLLQGNNKFKSVVGSGDTAITASGKMLIAKSSLGMSRPTGEISYNFQAEFKKGRYRFWLTDFMFIPYMRDRYANFVPATSKGMSLDADPGKLSAAEWKSHKKLTAKSAAVLGNEFKKALAKPLNKPEVTKKTNVSTKEW